MTHEPQGLEACFYVSPCPSKDWHALGPTGPIRSLRPNYVPPDPFKRGRKSPLHDLQGGANPKSIKIDIAHTYAIAGYGKDDLASCLVFLAVRCEIWGPGRYEDQLERAWVSFKTWCVANKRSTTILEFSKKELKITSQLGQCLRIFLCGQGCVPCPKEMNRLWDHCFKSAFLELAEAARLSERSWERIRHSSGGSLVGECPIRCGFRPG